MRARYGIDGRVRTAVIVAWALLLGASGACSEASGPLPPQQESLPEPSLSATGTGAGAGTLALVANGGDNTVSVIDVAAREEVATVEAGDFPRQVAAVPGGTLALVTNARSGDVSVLDLAGRRMVGTVPVGEFPTGVAVTPDGTLALVTNAVSDDVSIIDLATRAEVARVDVVDTPSDVAITPDGASALVVNRRTSGGGFCIQVPCEVSVIDISSRSEVARIPSGGSGPTGVAITPDGSRALVVNTESVPDNVAVIDLAGRTVVGRVNVGRIPKFAAITPDGSVGLVTNSSSGDISLIDIAGTAELDRVEVGGGPGGVAVTPDGALALVANDGDATVSLVDIAARSEVATVDVGELPGGVAITTLLEVEVDIKPGDDENAVNPESPGMVTVAVLTTRTAAGEGVDFDASSMAPSTVRFGPDRASPVHELDDAGDRELHLVDVDGDGDDDLVLHFAIQETGIESGDTGASLAGETRDGGPVAGRDRLRTVGREEAPVPEPPTLPGRLTSLRLFLNHADCGPSGGGGTGGWNIFLNGTRVGSAPTASPCRCNADEQEVAITDGGALGAWKPSGDNTISVEAVGTTPANDIAVGYIRAELATRAASATVAVFDATGGDASGRDLCEGFVWEETQSLFSATLE